MFIVSTSDSKYQLNISNLRLENIFFIPITKSHFRFNVIFSVLKVFFHFCNKKICSGLLINNLASLK